MKTHITTTVDVETAYLIKQSQENISSLVNDYLKNYLSPQKPRETKKEDLNKNITEIGSLKNQLEKELDLIKEKEETERLEWKKNKKEQKTREYINNFRLGKPNSPLFKEYQKGRTEGKWKTIVQFARTKAPKE